MEAEQKINSISALFWGSLFKKPHLSGYYLEDWSREIGESSSTKEKGKYEEAHFWYLYIHGDPLKISEWYERQQDVSPTRLPVELIGLYGAVFKSNDSFKVDNIEVRAETQLPQHFLEHTLLAEIFLLAKRYRAAWRILQSALKRHQTEFQSDKNRFLLGLIYDLLAREALAHDDFFQCDNWLSKMRTIINKNEIQALQKRWQWNRIRAGIRKGQVDGLSRIWSIEDAKNWPSFTDEWITITLGNLFFERNEWDRLDSLSSILDKEFDTAIAFQYLQCLKKCKDQPATSPKEFSEAQKALLFPFYETIIKSVGSELQVDFKIQLLEYSRSRLELSTAADFIQENDAFPNRRFFYYLISLFVAAMEQIRQLDNSDTSLGEELLPSIRAVQLLQFCFHETLIPPVYIYDMISEICAWNQRINLAAIKGEWRSKAPVPVAMFFQMFLMAISSLKVSEYGTDLGVSFSSSSGKISIDWHFQPLKEKASESMKQAYENRLNEEFDELSDGLFFIENNYPGVKHELASYLADDGLNAWQLDISKQS